eukprot:52239-Amphidinium_carterae.1
MALLNSCGSSMPSPMTAQRIYKDFPSPLRSLPRPAVRVKRWTKCSAINISHLKKQLRVRLRELHLSCRHASHAAGQESAGYLGEERMKLFRCLLLLLLVVHTILLEGAQEARRGAESA